ncbi:MAG: UDP-N-acetylmuramoyl-tripeptide--D-alanyl-D-alanine ligase [Sandaracinaceae bacterium]
MSATPIPVNRAPFGVDELIAASGATVRVRPASATCGVTTDSRAAKAGDLFVALSGDAHDGHGFVAAAVDAGATAVLVEREVDVPEGVGVLQVDDTLVALGALANAHRRRRDIPVVAITGSVGKTSTKELCRAALAGAGFSPMCTRGNLNNRIGVPMTLFTLDETHDAAVVEAGMNMPGEISQLAAIIEPTVGLVTAVEAVHTEGVGNLAGVRAEKGALLEALGDGATAIYRHRDEMAGFATDAGVTLSHGRNEDADVRLVESTLSGDGTSLTVAVPGRDDPVSLVLPWLGDAAAENATAALAVVHAVAPDQLDAAASALSEVGPVVHRMVAERRADGVLLIDDTYNASPASIRSALDASAALASQRGGRLIVVLGDMLELGRDEQRMHQDVGRDVVKHGAARFIACGERMTHAGRAALTASMEGSGPRTQVVLLRKVEDAASCAAESLREHDVVLVKGSRGMRMERVIASLVDEVDA